MSAQESTAARRTSVSDAGYIDPRDARNVRATALQLRVVELRNEGSSWRAIARSVGASVRTVREAWGAVNRRVRGGEVAPHRERENPMLGNERLLRGIPVVGGASGAIHGTRPGDPAWRAEQDAALPAKRPTRTTVRANVDG